MRTLRLVALGVALGIGLLASACAAPVHASAATPKPTTCKARKIIYWSAYRADNDLFAGMKGPSCITWRDPSLTIDDNYKAQGPVVAYPAIRYGPYYGSGDTESVLPERVTRTGHLTLSARATGKASGVYLTDVDAWFYPGRSVASHGNGELVIGLKYTGWAPGAGWRRMSIAHHWYWARHSVTCVPGTTDCWPITVLRATSQVTSRSLRMPTFLWHMRKAGWLGKGEWLGSVAFGTECWSGCKGLSDALAVTGTVAK